ncbi:armadillo-like helical domain-containing protein 3 isoform 8-T16 [Alca torda]
MAQTEKKGGLLRKSSASKKPLKEKVVLMYDEIFTTEDPSKCNPRFWEELFLMKVNLEYLEGKLEALDGEELMKIKDNINCLFQHCIQALGEEHPIRVVNALQTLCALIRGVHQKNKSTSGFDIINMLVGFDKAELCMKNLMESLDSLLCAEGSESLKSLCLKLLLCLVTVTDNISQNTILEYVMINSIFEAILQILSSPLSRREHGYDAVVLLALLVNYRKYESVNPYIVKLSIVDDEATLNGMGLVIAQALSEYNRQYKDKEEEHQSGFLSALTNMVGSMFIADADEKISVQTNEAILLALYEAVHLNRNFITVLAQSHPEMGLMTTPTSPIPTTPVTPLGTTPPSSDVISSAELPLDADVQTSNLLITFLKYSSIVMQDTKDEHRLHSGKLCLIILTCIAEDQYANAFLHDDNMNFRVNLHRMPMRHRKKAADKNLPCRPLVCAVLDLMVEFIVTHMMKEFPMDLYVRCIQIVHKLLCYQKKCRVRLHYTWRELWSALINLLKFLMSNETVLLAKHNIFTLALMVVNLFNMFITYGDTFLPTPSSYDELYYEIIRMHQNFDNLYSMVLRLSTNAGQWKEPASKVTHALVNISCFCKDQHGTETRYNQKTGTVIPLPGQPVSDMFHAWCYLEPVKLLDMFLFQTFGSLPLLHPTVHSHHQSLQPEDRVLRCGESHITALRGSEVNDSAGACGGQNRELPRELGGSSQIQLRQHLWTFRRRDCVHGLGQTSFESPWIAPSTGWDPMVLPVKRYFLQKIHLPF